MIERRRLLVNAEKEPVNYLRFTAAEDCVFTLDLGKYIIQSYYEYVEYSLDEGVTWNKFFNTHKDNPRYNQTIRIATPTIASGDSVIWRGKGVSLFPNSGDYSDYCYFSSTGRFYASGNLMTLLFGDEDVKTITYQHAFYRLFKDCTKMLTAPELPATTLANNCYREMFSGCTSLTTAPELPATTLATACYNNMFNGCTSLTTAPELPATTLAGSCYYYMFNGCSNLSYIKALFTSEPQDTYTKNWVVGVSASGTFVKNSAATWNVVGNNGIPSGWTVQTA